MDHLTPEKRSWNMSRIKSKDTTPERIVRSFLHRNGFRFRLHVKDLPGKPDIVLPKYKTVIEVRGCFWHRHSGCKVATNPSTNAEFWQKKFAANVSRDKQNEQELKKLGWNVIVIWECEIKQNKFQDKIMQNLKPATNYSRPQSKEFDKVEAVRYFQSILKETTLIWWNTGIDPFGSNSKSDSSLIENIILQLCLQADIVVLGEYKNIHNLSEKLNHLSQELQSQGIAKSMVIYDLYSQNGRVEFKNLVIYNAAVYQIPNNDNSREDFFRASSGVIEGGYRIGQRLQFISLFFEKPLDIYVVHWSKYNELDGEDVKIAAANKLADDAEKSSNNYKIFVGDFNTEPYSKPMSHLKASRSIQYVIDRGGFYNPFWRHLHMEGTINYCSPRSIKCYFPTFDQILIDRNLLSEKRLRLNSFILGDSFYDPPKGEHRPIGITFHTQEDKESQNGI